MGTPRADGTQLCNCEDLSIKQSTTFTCTYSGWIDYCDAPLSIHYKNANLIQIDSLIGITFDRPLENTNNISVKIDGKTYEFKYLGQNKEDGSVGYTSVDRTTYGPYIISLKNKTVLIEILY